MAPFSPRIDGVELSGKRLEMVLHRSSLRILTHMGGGHVQEPRSLFRATERFCRTIRYKAISEAAFAVQKSRVAPRMPLSIGGSGALAPIGRREKHKVWPAKAMR